MGEVDGGSPPRGGGRVKLGDVAAAAGVHASTVSRVLRGDPGGRVSVAVAERIRAAADRLGYRADPLAAALRTRSTRLIGVIVHDINDPVYPPILRGIETALGPAGFMAVIGNTGYDPGAEMAMFEQMTGRLVDGVVLGTARLEDPVVSRARAEAVPMVSVLRRAGGGDCGAVVNDCRGGMVQLADAVVARGHRDIAVIAAPQDISTGRERHEGLMAGLAAHGLAPAPDRVIHVSQMMVEQGAAAAAALLDRRSRPPTVIMAVNDLVAFGALRALQARGLRCPEDVSLTGFNDIPHLDLLGPPLASVRLDGEAIGRRSAEMLLRRLRDPREPARVERIDCRLCLRASLGSL